MLSNIKEELLSNPDSLMNVLEKFGYANIKNHGKYMSFGRDQDSSAKSIVIKLENNKYLYVTDYPRNINKDLFSYIIEQRNVTFKDVITVVNNELGITDYSIFTQRKRQAFGGFYNKIKKETPCSPPTIYDYNILNKYAKIGNVMFLRDKISLESQRYFDLRFDVENDGIVIPILDQFGNLMAVKERVNHEVGPEEQKYWYVVPGQMSKTLYGYAQNYNYLTEGTVLVFEAEKSVMQCYSYGIRNAVALGSGSISRNQIKMLYEIQPERVIFLHDVGYEKESILKNVNLYKRFGRFSDTEVGYWDWERSGYTDKFSPSDLGKDELERILREEIVFEN